MWLSFKGELPNRAKMATRRLRNHEISYCTFSASTDRKNIGNCALESFSSTLCIFATYEHFVSTPEHLRASDNACWDENGLKALWKVTPPKQAFLEGRGADPPLDFQNFLADFHEIFWDNFNAFWIQNKISRPRRIFYAPRILYKVQLFWKVIHFWVFGHIGRILRNFGSKFTFTGYKIPSKVFGWS